MSMAARDHTPATSTHSTAPVVRQAAQMSLPPPPLLPTYPCVGLEHGVFEVVLAAQGGDLEGVGVGAPRGAVLEPDAQSHTGRGIMKA
jgi:hypothetical protein